ncbi:hypothetical protein ACFE04_005322 [Oxalis oulophora]
MDFKSKGKMFVGTICNTFESIRLEVDNLLTEDTSDKTSHQKHRKARPLVLETNHTDSIVAKECHLASVDEHFARGINQVNTVNQDVTHIPSDLLENPISHSTQQQFDDDKIQDKSGSATEYTLIEETPLSPQTQHFAIPGEEEAACFNASLDDFIDSNWEENTFTLLQTNKSPVTPTNREEITEIGLKSSINRSLSLESYTLIENSLADRVLSSNDLADVAQSGSEDLLISSNNNAAQNGFVASSSPLPLESCGPLWEHYEDISESEMENIDLCDSVKLEDICIFADDSELYAVSRRTQKLRSYKKKIKDAFSSRKRLAKEYQQIAIWYGDTDVGSSQDTSHTLMPTITPTKLDSENSGEQDISDWELL